MANTGFVTNNSNYPTETDLAQIFVHYTSPPPSNTPTGFVVNNGNYPSTTSPESTDLAQIFQPYSSGFRAPATGFVSNNYDNEDLANVFQYVNSVPFDFSNSLSTNYSVSYTTIGSVNYGILTLPVGTFYFTTTVSLNIVQIFLVGGGGNGGNGSLAYLDKYGQISYIFSRGGGGGSGGTVYNASGEYIGTYAKNSSFNVSVSYAETNTTCIINNVVTLTASAGQRGTTAEGSTDQNPAAGGNNQTSYGEGGDGGVGYNIPPNSTNISATNGSNGVLNSYTGYYYGGGGGGGGYGPGENGANGGSGGGGGGGGGGESNGGQVSGGSGGNGGAGGNDGGAGGIGGGGGGSGGNNYGGGGGGGGADGNQDGGNIGYGGVGGSGVFILVYVVS